MLVINLSIFFIFGIFFLWIPLRKEFRLAKEADFKEQLYLFRLKMVRNYYSELEDLSYREIMDKYNVTESYNRIR